MHNPARDDHGRVADRERTSLDGVLFSPAVTTSHHVLDLLPEMETMLRATAEDVRGARERIWIETYIFRHDRLARAMGESLARAAARGVDVRLLYDPLGCNETDPAMFRWMRDRQISVRAYRPARVQWRDERWWPRDHSRIVVIDDVGYTGGAAWGDEWLPQRYGGMGWHDVCTRLAGPCVGDFARGFEQRWAEAVGESGPADLTTGARYPDVEFVADSPYGAPEVMRRYCGAVRDARERVWVENAYFLAPGSLSRELFAAADRGVDVRLILPANTDLPILKRAARARFGEWMSHGIRIFEYLPRMVHSKFAVIDDDWATVGTFNINAVSMRYSNEVNLFVFAREYVAQVAALFARDQAQCDEVTHALLARRSVRDRVHDRVADVLLALLEVGRGGA